MKSSTFLLLIISTVLFHSCGQKEQPALEDQSEEVTLGKLEHGFDINTTVKDKFDEGLLLLHNFEYEDALTAFEKATAVDSSEILTHWGEAMCHYKALWRLQNTDNGKAILSRLGNNSEERLAAIKDPIKKGLWKMVELMYGEGEFDERNEQIKLHMAALHKKYPQSQEVAAFYALSLIWATEEYGDGSPDLRLAASVADKVISMNPAHPGALHYKIHALDGPTSAQDALEAADVYAKIAPDAAHALHMPSHIYLAIGEWDGVVNSNQRSYDASVKRMIDKGLKDGARGYHSLAWLHYGLLQQGRHKEANKVLNEMLNHVPKDPTKAARGYLLGMQSRQLGESGAIDDSTILDVDIDIQDLSIISKSIRSLLRAQLAFQSKDKKTITDEINWLSAQIYTDSLSIKEDGIAMCAAGNSRYAPTENGVRIAQVNKAIMQGYRALLSHDNATYERWMLKASEIESLTNYPTGPPTVTQPSFELYGEWLLDQGRNDEALAYFDKALDRMPRRSRSLKGKLTALNKLNKLDQLKLTRADLEKNYANADDNIKKSVSD